MNNQLDETSCVLALVKALQESRKELLDRAIRCAQVHAEPIMVVEPDRATKQSRREGSRK